MTTMEVKEALELVVSFKESVWLAYTSWQTFFSNISEDEFGKFSKERVD